MFVKLKLILKKATGKEETSNISVIFYIESCPIGL